MRFSLAKEKYSVEILERFRMMDCKSKATPKTINMKLLSNSYSNFVDPTMYRQLIGSLMYLVNTKSDICFAVNALTQYMVEPRHVHWMEKKHMMRYLHGMIEYGLRYVSGGYVKLQGYTKSDWVGSVVDQKSTYECCFSFGSSMISWLSRKHTSIELSIEEAEYIASSVASREVVWLQNFLAGIFDLELEKNLIHCDNQSCVRLSENPIFHDKSKHIDIKYHYI
jgi:hypothetical protein